MVMTVLKSIALRGLLVVALAVAGASAALAAKDEIYVRQGGVFSSGWDYAIGGYDTVAYFTEGQPIQGSDEFTTEYKGVRWRFVSQENLDKFLADPEKYRPQYGGYCAYAVANNTTAEGNPENWAIHNGKLYLNVSKGVQRRWLKDKDGYVEKADNNWPDVLK